MSESAVSLTSLIASLNVSVIFEPLATPVALSAGLNVIVGATESFAVNVAFAADIALSEASSTVVPIAT